MCRPFRPALQTLIIKIPEFGWVKLALMGQFPGRLFVQCRLRRLSHPVYPVSKDHRAVFPHLFGGRKRWRRAAAGAVNASAQLFGEEMEQVDAVVAGAVVYDDGSRTVDADVDAVTFVVISAVVGDEDVRTGGTVTADTVFHGAAVTVIADEPQGAYIESADVLIVDSGAFEPQSLTIPCLVEGEVVQVGIAQQQIIHLHPGAPHYTDATVGPQILDVVVRGQGGGGRLVGAVAVDDAALLAVATMNEHPLHAVEHDR